MGVSELYYEKATAAFKSALEADDRLERARLIDETVRWHRLAIETQIEEQVEEAASRSFDPPAAC